GRLLTRTHVGLTPSFRPRYWRAATRRPAAAVASARRLASRRESRSCTPRPASWRRGRSAGAARSRPARAPASALGRAGRRRRAPPRACRSLRRSPSSLHSVSAHLTGYRARRPCYDRPMSPAWLTRNPRARRDQKYGAAQRAVIDPAAVPDIGKLPGGDKGATPLQSLPALAERLGVGELRVKDESQRMGFGAFKALGGVFAVHEIVASDKKRAARDFTFTTASSGNHGRAVALGAQSVGAQCTIFLPKFTSAEKEAAIRAMGADVIR